MSSVDASPSLARGRWVLDPADAEIGFVTRTFWGTRPVSGTFGEYRGRLDLSATPEIELVIVAASLDTHNAKRDEHLRSADFFAVAEHPEVRFVSTELEVHGDHLHVCGTLSAAGHSITIEPQTHVRAADGALVIDAVARVPHRDLGMTTNPGGMIQSKSWLHVRGRLVAAFSRPSAEAG